VKYLEEGNAEIFIVTLLKLKESLPFQPFTNTAALPGHEMPHTFFQPVKGQLKHRKNRPDDIDGMGIRPMITGNRVEPDGSAKIIGEKF
jgi:hypothetical protein